MYEVYLDDFLFPVTPGEMSIKVKNQNTTVVLMDEGEINKLKRPGLTDIEFTALLPNTEYNFSKYYGGFKNAAYFLERLNGIKESKKAVPFVVSRFGVDGEYMYGTSILVSLEDYPIQESAGEGTDVMVKIKLKQYRTYGTKVYKLTAIKTSDGSSVTVATLQGG